MNRPSVYKQISPNLFPNFPKDLSPSGSALFGKLGNWEMSAGTYFPISQKISAHLAQQMSAGTYFPISQFPKRSQPIWLSIIWEIGKLGSEYMYMFPNFPISQKISAHLAQHYLGNWEVSTGTYFPISQIIPAQMAQHYVGNWEPLTLNSCNLNPYLNSCSLNP